MVLETTIACYDKRNQFVMKLVLNLQFVGLISYLRWRVIKFSDLQSTMP